MCRRWRPRVIKESVGMGVAELCPPPAIPQLGGCPGRTDISGRTYQDIRHRYNLTRIRIHHQ